MFKMKEGQFKARLEAVLIWFLAFAVPFAVTVFVFCAKEIAPFSFGEKSFSLLSIDLWGQYFPMYVQQATADSLAEKLFSFNGAFGYNNYLQTAYYCSSIFLPILKLVPISKMIAALDVFCLLKPALSSLACLAFLEYKTKKRSIFLLSGAVAYALCSYALAYMAQFMWTDCLIYMPLILIGLDRITEHKDPFLYTIMLAVAMISNFYISFSMCLFLLLFFLSEEIPKLNFKENTWGGYLLKVSLRFALFSLLAAGLAAVSLIPVGLGIQNTLASDIGFPEQIKWYHSIGDIFQSMMPEQKLSLEYGVPNISTGSFMLFLVPLYFCNSRFSVKERVSKGILLVFLIVSMNLNILDYIWHGFHLPNQLPGRWTFMYSLFVVYLSSMGLTEAKELSLPRFSIGAVIGCAFAVVGLVNMKINSQTFSGKLYIFLFVVGVFSALLVSQTKKSFERLSEQAALEKSKRGYSKSDTKQNLIWVRAVCIVFTVILAVTQLVDSGVSFAKTALLEEGGLKISDEKGYTNTVEKFCKYGDLYRCENEDFYRIEANTGFTFNPSMLGRYRGLGYYSSTMDGNTYKLLEFLGNRVYAKNVSTIYNIGSPVQNSLFAVNKFFDVNKNIESMTYGVSLKQTNDDCDIYENNYPLPIAYAVSDDAGTFTVTDQIRGISNQNSFLNALCGQDINVFKKESFSAVNMQNVTLMESADWNTNYFQTETGASEAVFDYSYKCTKDAPFYIEQNFRAGEITLTVNGNTTTFPAGDNKFKYIGKLRPGDEVTMHVSVKNVGVGCFGAELYSLDTAAWQSAYEKLSSGKMYTEEFDNTYIKGRIDLPADSSVMASIAQDGGWKVYCDGERVDTYTTGGALLTCKIPQGEHILEYKYSVPGLKEGMFISIVSLGVLVFMAVKPKLSKKS